VDAREAVADALLLPWWGETSHLEALLGPSAPGVIAQVREYPSGRGIRLSSAGMLPQRFLLHLSLPQQPSERSGLLRERIGESFRHAKVLNLRDLAIPMKLFADLALDFSDLAELIWNAWREDAGDSMRLRLLVDPGDLRGEYLRRFLGRRRGSELSGKNPRPKILEGRLEGAIRPVLPRGLDMDQALERLLEDYHDARPLDDAMGALAGPMKRAFRASLDPGEVLEDLPGILRVLGSGTIQRLPWELLREGTTFLGERFVFPRGTSFFVLGGRSAEGQAYEIKVFSGEERGGSLSQELRNLLHRAGGRPAEVKDGPSPRIVCITGREGLGNFLDAEDSQGGELLFIELPEEWQDAMDMEELSGRFLARGFRRVLSPLASFRDPREARIFRMAFFEQYFRGHGAGGALRYAQRSLLEAFGIHSGWFLYRIFGQAEDRTYSTRSSIRRGMDLSGL